METKQRIKVSLPLCEEEVAKLRAGDAVALTGEVFVARDAAHKRMADTLAAARQTCPTCAAPQEDDACRSAILPFDLRGATIYYMGPSPARPGNVIGSAGPTTSSRMDVYTPELLDLGLKGMIGKGRRSEEVIEAIVRNRAVYFVAIGGAGALLAKHITKSEVIAYDDLGAEAIRRLEVKDFPVIVAIDSEGNNFL